MKTEIETFEPETQYALVVSTDGKTWTEWDTAFTVWDINEVMIDALAYFHSHPDEGCRLARIVEQTITSKVVKQVELK